MSWKTFCFTISFTLPIFLTVRAHGSLSQPKPRNAIDGTLFPWNSKIPNPIPFDTPNWCASPSAKSTDPRHIDGSLGQSCFWFSNGCDIGCEKCDGNTGQKIPCCNEKFLYTGPNKVPPSWTGEGIVPDPAWMKKFDRQKARPTTVVYPKREATICDKRLRTLNTNAECGAEDDFWFFMPWRYPGISPVVDSCGAAGGRLKGQGEGSAGADYFETKYAKVGDVGSQLPPLETETVWQAGSDVEVGWTLKAWHGGGYSYRLCKVGNELNEECFQKTPLDFTGKASLRWGGKGGKQLYFDPVERGWQVKTGTVPYFGSMWRKMPIPRNVNEWSTYGASFDPVCDESEECKNSHYHPHNGTQGICKCSGDWNDEVEMMDKVHIPAHLEPGKYVLGWRWDCEESSQVWSSCADVTITSSKANVESSEFLRGTSSSSILID